MVRYFSKNDIEKMRRSGYDQSLLKDDKRRHDQVAAICQNIDAAFADVTLEDGTGLWEAQGHDDYQTSEKCAQYRAKDQKHDWKAISTKDLNRCNSSLSFFDAKGMRFHLPAFMISDLYEEYHFDLDLTLIDPCDYRRGQFALLNAAQKSAVRAYLNYVANRECDGQKNIIRACSKGFWGEE